MVLNLLQLVFHQMQRAIHEVNYVFVNFQIHMHKTFPFGKHMMSFLRIFLFLARPTKHNNKTPFSEILKPKMQQKKVHDLTIAKSLNL